MNEETKAKMTEAEAIAKILVKMPDEMRIMAFGYITGMDAALKTKSA